jgi:hypothetical protein
MPAKRTIQHTRANIDKAVRKLGGATQTAAKLGVVEATIRLWHRKGSLNVASAKLCLTLARLAEMDPWDFIADDAGQKTTD